MSSRSLFSDRRLKVAVTMLTVIVALLASLQLAPVSRGVIEYADSPGRLVAWDEAR